MVRQIFQHHTLTLLSLLLLAGIALGCSNSAAPTSSLGFSIPRPVADVLLSGTLRREPAALQAELETRGYTPAEAAWWTGLLLLVSGRAEEAAPFLSSAERLGLPPGLNLRCRTALADVVFLRGETEQAELEWRKVLQADPPDELRFLLMARIVAARVSAGDSAGASAAFSRWRAAFPVLTSGFRSPGRVRSALLTALGRGMFVLQLGIFGSRAAAEEYRRRADRTGIAVFVMASGGAWKVLAGPFPSRTQAERARRNLAARGFSCILKPWSGR